MQAVAAKSRVDLTVMLVSHDAFRRDLGRLERAAADPSSDAPDARRRVLTGWEIFKSQLRIHHEGEDRDLWPRMARGLGDRPDVRSALRELEAEHAEINPLLAAIDTAMANREAAPSQLGQAVGAFGDALEAHLKHEEEDGLPYVAEAVSDAEWKGFLADQRKNLGLSGAAEFFPWLLDRATPDDAARVAAIMPPPMKLILNRMWVPAYQSRGTWD